MKDPLLTIITPSYNLSSYIDRAIASVLNQTYGNYEYIVIDGASTDRTLSILKKYSELQQYKGKFKWISEIDHGQTHAINKGLTLAKGDWFAWLNADDYYEADAFIKMISYSKNVDDDVAVLYGNCLSHNRNKIIRNDPPSIVTRSTLKKGNQIYGPASFFRTTALRKVGHFDEQLDLWMDYDMYYRLSKKYKLSYMDFLVAHFTVRDNQKSDVSMRIEQLTNEAKYVSLKNRFPFMQKLLQKTLMGK